MLFKNLTYKLFVFYWPLVMFNYFLLMSTKINLTVLLVDLPLAIFVLKAVSICFKNSRDQFVFLFAIFAVYILLTGFAYAFTETPIMCYFKGIQYYFIPLCFAPLGYKLTSNYEYNKLFLYACAACFVIGFYLYATLPPNYMEYLAEVQGYENFSQDELFGAFRFSSFLPGSYNISYLSVPALILSLAYSSNQYAGIKKWLCYIIAGISFVAAIICQQRISMAFAILVVVFYILYFARRGNGKIFIVVIGIVALLVIVINNFISEMPFFDALQEGILGRFEKMNVSVAMSTRTGQYTSFDRETWWSSITGLGIGSCGHLAIPYNLKTINDGEFVKIYYEFGIIGTVFFAVFVFATLLRGVRFVRYLHAEVLIMLFFLGACVGASALTFFIYSSMLWFATGRIWNKDYLKLRRQEIIKVQTNQG